MMPRYEHGEAVRVIRNVRNDGTYPGMDTGKLLVRRGSVGYVRSTGTYLQDQIIYEVHFLDDDRLVGCREEELIGADEHWVDSRFEFREWVTPKMILAIGGETVASPGETGQILKVLRGDNDVNYHLRINGRTLQVGEAALEPAPEEEVPHGQ